MIVNPSIESNGTLVLTIVVDSLTSPRSAEFRAQADQAVVDSAGRVEVDCSQLEFIDSSGVGALLHLIRLLPEQRRPVRLTGVGKTVLANLELMCVHRIFDLEPRK
jgi:anti-anti-sigma factor